jgi:hypothetical protein
VLKSVKSLRYRKLQLKGRGSRFLEGIGANNSHNGRLWNAGRRTSPLRGPRLSTVSAKGFLGEMA